MHEACYVHVLLMHVSQDPWEISESPPKKLGTFLSGIWERETSFWKGNLHVVSEIVVSISKTLLLCSSVLLSHGQISTQLFYNDKQYNPVLIARRT